MKKSFRDIGKYLKRARENKGITQYGLAKALGYTSPQFVSNAERFLCTYPARKYSALVKHLDLDKTEFKSLVRTAKIKDIEETLNF